MPRPIAKHRFAVGNLKSSEQQSLSLNRDRPLLLDVYKRQAGYCAFKPEEAKMFLSKIYIRRAFRRHGIATALFDQVQKASGGKSAIYLTVNKHNSGSIEAYKKLGFAIVDQVVTDIGGGYVMDDYIMEKTL